MIEFDEQERVDFAVGAAVLAERHAEALQKQAAVKSAVDALVPGVVEALVANGHVEDNDATRRKLASVLADHEQALRFFRKHAEAFAPASDDAEGFGIGVPAGDAGPVDYDKRGAATVFIESRYRSEDNSRQSNRNWLGRLSTLS